MTPRHGAYGLCFDRLDPGSLDMLRPDVPPTWPYLAVTFEVGPASPADDVITRTSGVLACAFGGGVEVAGSPLTACFRGPRPPGPDELIHPGLAGIGIVAAARRGMVSVHAAVILGRDGAWMVLGPKGAGKSTLSGALAQRGFSILADDLAVVDHGRVLAGPRTIDLRADAASALGLTPETTRVRLGDRQRYPGPPGPAEATLVGVVEIRTGPEVRAEQVRPAARLGVLAQHLNLPDLCPPDQVFELCAIDYVRVHRPHHLGALPATVDEVLAIVGEPA